jgi:uncharacterized membrane protein YdjX (TVP38/TMEM64 family)|tara:strand:+ start:132 stop:761 length:630 start_codon:yes stop_codon:yes gene_type:complete
MSKLAKLQIICLIIYFLLSTSLVIFLITKLDIANIFDIDYLKQLHFSIEEVFLEHYISVRILYILIFLLYTFFLGLPLPAILFTSLVFDPLDAVLISTFCTTLGSYFTFFFIKAVYPNFNFKINKEHKKKYSFFFERIKKNELLATIIFRLIGGGLPFLIQNLILYTCRISKNNYFLGTFIGTIPGNFVLIYFSSTLFGYIKNYIFNIL